VPERADLPFDDAVGGCEHPGSPFLMTLRGCRGRRRGTAVRPPPRSRGGQGARSL